MGTIESVKEKLARLRCLKASKPAGVATCPCVNCVAVRRMGREDGVGRDILVSQDGRACYIIEGNDI